MGEVDPDFIQPLEHQPKPSIHEAEGIPLIDLSPFDSQGSDAESLHQLVAEVGEACRRWGFFQVINHGVPSRVRDRIESASKEFFALPKEEKRKSSRDETNLFGYSDLEITKSVRDWKEIFDCTIENPTVVYASDDPDDRELIELTNQWPQYPPDLRQVSLAFISFLRIHIQHKLHSYETRFVLQRSMRRIRSRNAEANTQATRTHSVELRTTKRSIPRLLQRSNKLHEAELLPLMPLSSASTRPR